MKIVSFAKAITIFFQLKWNVFDLIKQINDVYGKGAITKEESDALFILSILCRAGKVCERIFYKPLETYKHFIYFLTANIM